MFAVERHPDAFATLHDNLIDGPFDACCYQWPDWLPKQASALEDIVARHSGRLNALRGSVDVVCGGPPCQGYSTSGKRNPNDPRNRLFRQYLRLVRLVQPKLVLLENVPGIGMDFKASGKRSGLTRRTGHVNFAKRIVRGLRRAGYVTTAIQLNASDYGVPQSRKRYFIIGVLGTLREASNIIASITPELADARKTLFKSVGFPDGYQPSASDALKDFETARRSAMPDPDFAGFHLAPVGPRRNRFQRAMAQGISARHVTDRRLARHSSQTVSRFKLLQRECRAGHTVSLEHRQALGMRKLRTFVLAPDRPAGTVTTLPDDMIHYSEPRILTVRECARLQSFPDWFSFRGPYTAGGRNRAQSCPRYTQVGNAVPVLLARALGHTLDRLVERTRLREAA